MLINIRSGNNPSTRTKNRIKENPGPFQVKRWGSPPCMNGRPSVLVCCTVTEWFGWLPSHEIVIDVIEDSDGRS